MEFHIMKRKALQDLCKKHNLPANKTNLEMADMLTSLLKAEEKPSKGLDEIATVNDSKIVGRQPKKVRFCLNDEKIEFVDQEKNPDGKRSRRRSMIMPDLEKSDLIHKKTRTSEDSEKVQKITLRLTRSCAAKSIDGEEAMVRSPCVGKTKPSVENLTEDVEVTEKADVVENRVATRQSRLNAPMVVEEIIVQEEGERVFKLEEPWRKFGRKASKRKSIAPTNGIMETDDTIGRHKSRKQSREPIEEEAISVSEALAMVQEDSERVSQVKEETLRRSRRNASKVESISPNKKMRNDEPLGGNESWKQSEHLSLEKQPLRRSRRNASKDETNASTIPMVGNGEAVNITKAQKRQFEPVLENERSANEIVSVPELPRRSGRNVSRDEPIVPNSGIVGPEDMVRRKESHKCLKVSVVEEDAAAPNSKLGEQFLSELPRTSRRNVSRGESIVPNTGLVGFDKLAQRKERPKSSEKLAVEEDASAPKTEMGEKFLPELPRRSRRNTSRGESIIPSTGLVGIEETVQEESHKSLKDPVVEEDASAPNTEMGEKFLSELPRRSRRNASRGESIVPKTGMVESDEMVRGKESHKSLKDPVVEEDASAPRTEMGETSVLNKESSVKKSSAESKPRDRKYSRGRKRGKAVRKQVEEKLDFLGISYEPVLSCIKEAPDEVNDEMDSRSRVHMKKRNIPQMVDLPETSSIREIKGLSEVDKEENVVLEEASDLVPDVIISQDDHLSPIQHLNYLDKGISTSQHTDPRDVHMADDEFSEDNRAAKTVHEPVPDDEEASEENGVSNAICEAASVELKEMSVIAISNGNGISKSILKKRDNGGTEQIHKTTEIWQIASEDHQVGALVKNSIEEVAQGRKVTSEESGNEKSEELVDEKDNTASYHSKYDELVEVTPLKPEEISESRHVISVDGLVDENSLQQPHETVQADPFPLMDMDLFSPIEAQASKGSVPRVVEDESRVNGADSMFNHNESQEVASKHETVQADPFPLMDMDPLSPIEAQASKGSVPRVVEGESRVNGADSMFSHKESQEVAREGKIMVRALKELEEASIATETILSVHGNLESVDFEENIGVMAQLALELDLKYVGEVSDVNKLADVKDENVELSEDGCEYNYSEIFLEGEEKEFLEAKEAKLDGKFSDEIKEKKEITKALVEEFDGENSGESVSLIPEESQKFHQTSKMSEDYSPLRSQDYSPSNLEDEENETTTGQNYVCENKIDFVEREYRSHLQQVLTEEVADLKKDTFLDLSRCVNAALEENICKDDKLLEEKAAMEANFYCKGCKNLSEEVENEGASSRVSLVEPGVHEDYKENAGYLQQIIPEELADLMKVAILEVGGCANAALEEHICEDDKLSEENAAMEANFDCMGSRNLAEEVENARSSLQISLVEPSNHEDHKENAGYLQQVIPEELALLKKIAFFGVSGCVDAVLEEHICKDGKVSEENAAVEASFDCKGSRNLAEEVENAQTSPQISVVEPGDHEDDNGKVAEEDFGASTLGEPLSDCAEVTEENSNGQTMNKNIGYVDAEGIEEGNAGYHIGNKEIFNSNKWNEPVQSLEETSEEIRQKIIFQANDLLPIQKSNHLDYPTVKEISVNHGTPPRDGCLSDKEYEDYNGSACMGEEKFAEADESSKTIQEPVLDHVVVCEENGASNEIYKVVLQELEEMCVLESDGNETSKSVLEDRDINDGDRTGEYIDTWQIIPEGHEATAENAADIHEEVGVGENMVTLEEELGYANCKEFVDEKENAEEHLSIFEDMLLAVPPQKPEESSEPQRTLETSSEYEEEDGVENIEREEVMVCSKDPEGGVHERENAGRDDFEFCRSIEEISVFQQTHEIGQADTLPFKDIRFSSFAEVQASQVSAPRDVDGEFHVDSLEVERASKKASEEFEEASGATETIQPAQENLEHGELEKNVEVTAKLDTELDFRYFSEVSEVMRQDDLIVENDDISNDKWEFKYGELVAEELEKGSVERMEEKFDVKVSGAVKEMNDNAEVFEEKVSAEDGATAASVMPSQSPEFSQTNKMVEEQFICSSMSHVDNSSLVDEANVPNMEENHVIELVKDSVEGENAGSFIAVDNSSSVVDEANVPKMEENHVIEHVEDSVERENAWSLLLFVSKELGDCKDDAVSEVNCHVHAVLDENIDKDEKLSKEKADAGVSLHCNSIKDVVMDKVDNGDCNDKVIEENSTEEAIEEHFGYVDANDVVYESNSLHSPQLSPKKLDDNVDNEEVGEDNGCSTVLEEFICGDDEALEQKSEVANVEENVGTLQQLALEELDNHKDHMVKKVSEANGSGDAVLDDSICEYYEAEKDHPDVEINNMTEMKFFAEVSPKTEMGSDSFAILRASVYQEELGDHEDHVVEKVSEANGSEDAVRDEPICEDYEAEKDNPYVEIDNFSEIENFAGVSPSKTEMGSSSFAVSSENAFAYQGDGESKFDTEVCEFSSSEINLLSGDNVGEEDESSVHIKNGTEVAEAEHTSEAGSEDAFTDTNKKKDFSLPCIDLADYTSNELELQGFDGNTDLFLLHVDPSEDKGNGFQMESVLSDNNSPNTNLIDDREDGNILISQSMPFTVEEVEVHQPMSETIGKKGIEGTSDEINSLLRKLHISSAAKRKCFRTSMTRSTPKKSFECLNQMPAFEMKENTLSVKREQSAATHQVRKSVAKRRALENLQSSAK